MYMLSECIKRLGADPTAQTPGADLVGIESQGLVQTVSDPRTTFGQSLHAVLVAELADVEAWDLLASLAEGMGEDEMAQNFRQALAQEQEHLAKVRSWYQSIVRELVS
jgi:ferritin-like metal-binding protein YciE